MDSTRLIPLGVITGAHGVRGQVKIRSFTANPEDITAYGALTDKNGRVFDITITGGTPDAFIANIKGISTRDDAEKLRNIELCVPRSALPAAQENEYYYEDMVGLKVLTADNTPYGTITAMHNFGAGDIVAIKRFSGEEELVPFGKKTFLKIDVSSGIAVIVPPEIIA